MANLAEEIPHSKDAEEYILGAVLLENSSLDEVIQIIRPDDLYSERNRIIFEEMLDLRDRGIVIDYVSLTEALETKGKLASAGGASYISQLADRIPTTANIEYYASIVKNKSVLRSLINAASSIVKIARQPYDDVSDAVEEAEQLIFSINRDLYAKNKGLVKIGSLVTEVYHNLTRISKGEISQVGIPTGFVDLDTLLMGLHSSDLVIIAGRPSMGKTALALNISQYIACVEKIPVALFSLEMSKEQVVHRLLASEARIDQFRLRTGYLHGDEWNTLLEAAGTISDAPLYIDDTPAITSMEMRAKLRRLAMSESLGVVVIDYLQLMSSRRRIDSREQEISEISRSLKAVAKEFNVPVVALSQLNRKVEDRENKRPRMSDLRESGAIEQDADVICFIYRDEVYNEASPEKGIAEIIVAKHRNGPTDTIKLKWFAEYTRFENYSGRE
ncbi:MAG: replicative DNA helicase [Deltaproteobacteria bacterium]|nr:replicative DNA helicase [Deltaproteobacteria bacterium]